MTEYHASKSEPNIVYAREGHIEELQAEIDRLREDVAWKAKIIQAADTEMGRLRAILLNTALAMGADCAEFRQHIGFLTPHQTDPAA